MRRKPDHRTRTPRTAIMIGAMLVTAVTAAVTGCGGSHDPSALPHPSCGSAVTHFLNDHTQVLGTHRDALTCFVKGARTCEAASIWVTLMGVDTGTDYVFAIKPDTTPCQVTEYSQYYSANFGGSKEPIRTVSCRRTAVTSSGVMLRCAGHVVLIPAKVAART